MVPSGRRESVNSAGDLGGILFFIEASQAECRRFVWTLREGGSVFCSAGDPRCSISTTLKGLVL